MKRGFTLFEILLVLFVMSMIVIGGIQYAQRQQEQAAAQQLGQRLYQYGIAASEYARQNPDKFTVPHEVYGIEWLKTAVNPETCTNPNDPQSCKTFLGKDYDLNFSSIVIGTLQGDPDAMDDQIYTKLTPDSAGVLNIELIELGTVYRYSKDAAKYEVDLSLPGQAATAANEYTEQYGNARITYSVENFNANTDINDIHIVGVPNTSTPNVDAGYLRTDGSNEMDGDLRFSTRNHGVVFENGTKISQFEDRGLSDKSFNPADHRSEGENLTSDFAWGDFLVERTNSGKQWRPLVRDGVAYNQQNSLCFLTGFEGSESGDVCRVIPSAKASGGVAIGDWVLFLKKTNGTGKFACFARCLVFNQ